MDEPIRSFTLWALDVLQLQPHRDGHDVYTLDVPEPLRASLDGAERVRFTFDVASEGSARDDRDGAPERITPQSRLFVWLVEQLRERGPVVHAAPARQPARVHELTAHLFSHYTIDGGNVHLAGCTLEDRPILRLTFGQIAQGEIQREQLTHVLIRDDGEPLNEQTLAALHLDRLAAWKGKLPEIDPAVLDRWLQAGQDLVTRQHGLAADDLVAAALIWCKYSAGKLALTIGPRTVELPFAGWAGMLAEGLARPAPFTCPASGISSYHLAATDDGRITAAEAITTCEESGRRVIQTDLEICAASGRRALAEFMVTCPVSQSRVLRSCLAACRMCRQSVSPKAIQSGRCAACRSLRPVGKADPRLARVLGEHPELDRWHRWRIAETASVYILVAAGILQRLLVVVDKQTLQARLVAKGHRFTANWTEVSGEKAGMNADG